MNWYMWIAVFLSVFVNVALMLGTGWLCRHSLPIWRVILSAVASGIYALLCLQPGLYFLGKTPWRVICLALVGGLAFGRSLKRILAFFLLFFAMEGVVTGVGDGSMWLAIPSVIVIFGMCAVAFRNGNEKGGYVPVELCFGGKCVKLTALRDTGNTLRDPITGVPVLVVDSNVSRELTGLSRQQLQQPVEVMRQPPIPGLRLIPYKTIGQSMGLILGVRISSVQIGSWKGGLTVAFAPEEFSSKGEFQALTGGTV